MSEYDNTNRGALWSNKDKMREGKKDPNWRGSINVEGKEYWLAAWKTSSDNPDAPLMSISVTPKEEKPKTLTEEGTGAPVQFADIEKELNDEIPF